MNERSDTRNDDRAHDDVVGNDLVIWALGALDETDATRVARDIEADPALRAEAERVQAHLTVYDAMPDAPPPPPFENVEQVIAQDTFDRAKPPRKTPRKTRRKTRRPGVWFWGAAAALVLLGLGIVYSVHQDERASVEQTTLLVGQGWSEDGDGPIAGEIALRQMVLRAERGAAELRWQSQGRGIHLIADRGTAIHLDEDHSEYVAVLEGRAWIEVEPARTQGSKNFLVGMGEHEVEVIGTVFVVDAGALLVDVLRGRVEVDEAAVLDGQRWTRGSVASRPAGPVAWLPRPTLTLEQDSIVDEGQQAFALTFRNPSAVTVQLPAPGGNRTGLWMEWLDEQGKRLKSLPIRPEALEERDREWLRGDRSVGLAPGGERAIWIRFRAAERPAGAYRCRALVRPAGAPPVLSNALGLKED